MPRNGNGSYSLPQPAFVPGTTIASSPVNSDLSDIGAALSQSISKDGQTSYTGNQPMGGNKFTNLGAGTASTDSVNLGQVADGTLTYGGVAGGTADALTITPSPGITAYSVGQMFSFKAASTNTGAVTVNVNGVGAGAVTWPDGTALGAGDIVANGMYEIEVQAATPVFHLQTTAKPPVTRGGGTMTGTLTMSGAAINEAKGADIASATTTDIGAATGNYVDVTGTTTITGLGTVQAGTERTVRFTGILTLTHNGTSLILPTGANITTAAGDVAAFRSLGSGNWICTEYTRANGLALGAMPTFSNVLGGAVALNNTSSYFTGPAIAQGTVGTFLVIGTVTVVDTVGPANFDVRLNDGVSTLASTRVSTYLANAGSPATLVAIVTNPAGNLRIDVADITSTSGFIVNNFSGQGKDSVLYAIRIA